MMKNNTPLQAVVDVYESSWFYRILALLAGWLAWTFDGVEQGVYSVMSRQALKELIPGLEDLVHQLNQLSQQKEALQAGGQAAAGLEQQIQELTAQIDPSVAWYFSVSLALWLWGAAAGGILFGRLGDRYGRVKTLILAVITYSTFTGLSAVSTHWTLFAACRFCGALGLGGAWPLSVALMVETWPDSWRPVLAGLMGAGANVGYWIAAHYSHYMLTNHYSWRAIIAVGCLIGFSCLLVIVFVPEPTKWLHSRHQKQPSTLGDLFTPRYRRSTIVGSLLSTVALLGTWGSFLWFPTYVDQITEGTIYANVAKADIAGWQSYGQILGGFMGGLLASWMGNKGSWCFLCVTAWAAVVALFGFNNEYGLQMMWMGMVSGLFVTAYFGWLPRYLSELFPTRIRATGQGFSFNIGRVLAGIGVLGTGWISQHFDYQMGAICMASIYLTGLIVIHFAPNTGGRMVRDEEDAAPSA